MHLVGPYMTTTNYKKKKQKPRTKAQQAAFEQSHREYNKSMKRMGCHDQMMSLEGCLQRNHRQYYCFPISKR